MLMLMILLMLLVGVSRLETVVHLVDDGQFDASRSCMIAESAQSFRQQGKLESIKQSIILQRKALC